MTEARIYHLALPADWRHALERGLYDVSTRGLSLAVEGFIHCSFAQQIEPVANRWYRDLDQVVILRLDREALGAEVRVEPSSDGSGELFPHVYGPVPTAAVAETMAWARQAGQDWTLPDAIEMAE
jgi:glutathione S-transferase